jgi:hypothetical protein
MCNHGAYPTGNMWDSRNDGCNVGIYCVFRGLKPATFLRDDGAKPERR